MCIGSSNNGSRYPPSLYASSPGAIFMSKFALDAFVQRILDHCELNKAIGGVLANSTRS